MIHMNGSNQMDLRTCPECGEEFIYNAQSIYFVRNSKTDHKKITLCSYNCYIKTKAKQRAKKKKEDNTQYG